MESATPIRHDSSSADASRDPEFAESLGRGHEQRDTYIKPILVFVLVLCVSIVIVQFAVWGLQKLLERQNALTDPRGNSGVAQASVSTSMANHVPPPEPRLQPSPFHQSLDREDMAELMNRWNTELSTVGKFAGDPDRVHLPVDRVIDEAAQKGIDALRPKATGGATSPSK